MFGWVGSALASCAATCACNACSFASKEMVRKSARLAYCVLFTLAMVLAWLLRDFAKPIIDKLPCTSPRHPSPCFGSLTQQVVATFWSSDVGACWAYLLRYQQGSSTPWAMVSQVQSGMDSRLCTGSAWATLYASCLYCHKQD